MRKSTAFLIFTGLNILALALIILHSRHAQDAALPGRLERARLVEELRLTDLCLFTEARYTRNPALADLHSPFQDHPGALEHFPSGSLVAPPDYNARENGQPR